MDLGTTDHAKYLTMLNLRLKRVVGRNVKDALFKVILLAVMTIFIFASINAVTDVQQRTVSSDAVQREEQKIPREQVIKSVNISKSSKKPLVLIVANQRSGSTFLGEIFNQNPNAFYLFEPLFPFSKQCDKLEKERTELLGRQMRCDFRGMSDSYKQAFSITKFSDISAECTKHNLCFETSHKPLLKQYAQLCESDNQNHANVSINKHRAVFQPDSSTCGYPLNPSLLSRLCKANSIAAFKVLRLCSLGSFQSLFRDLTQEGNDVFVIHLVRDPRAVIASRVALRVDGIRRHMVPVEIDLLCSRYERNMDYILNLGLIGSTPNVISNKRYMRVRHEDFTLNAMKITSAIYRFIGMKTPEEVKTFLSKSQYLAATIARRIEIEDERALKEKREISEYSKNKRILRQMNNPFGTVRDPSEVLTRWRKELPYSVVQLVQQKCGNVMIKMGYKLFNSNVDLINLTKSYF